MHLASGRYADNEMTTPGCHHFELVNAADLRGRDRAKGLIAALGGAGHESGLKCRSHGHPTLHCHTSCHLGKSLLVPLDKTCAKIFRLLWGVHPIGNFAKPRFEGAAFAITAALIWRMM
jgi:hypothetical protein